MAEEAGLDSWFLHEKLVLSFLSKRDAIDLTRRIPGPEDPFAHVMRVDFFERALARTWHTTTSTRWKLSTSEGDSSKASSCGLSRPSYSKGWVPHWRSSSAVATEEHRFLPVLSLQY